MSNKVDTSFMVHEPRVFVERQLYKARKRYHLNRSLFISFNILSMLMTFAILAIGTLVLSGILWSYSNPNYFYVTTVATAILTLTTALINFFYVKNNMDKYKIQKEFIHTEIIKYETNSEVYKNAKDKDFEIFHRVAVHIGYEAAKEVDDERTK